MSIERSFSSWNTESATTKINTCDTRKPVNFRMTVDAREAHDGQVEDDQDGADDEDGVVRKSTNTPDRSYHVTTAERTIEESMLFHENAFGKFWMKK